MAAVQRETEKRAGERYTIGKQIPGSFSGLDAGAPVVLFEAVDEQLERPVTLGIMTSEAAADASAREAFIHHRVAWSSVHHPCVLDLLDAGEWEGRPYAVFSRLIDTYPVTSPERPATDAAGALRITRQVAEGLASCRAGGLDDLPLRAGAVRIGKDGSVAIVPLDTGPNMPARPLDDAGALGSLLSLLLTGTSDPAAAERALGELPTSVQSLVGRLRGEGGPGEDNISGAGAAAQAIAVIEAQFAQPTEAYDPVAAPPAEAQAGTPNPGMVAPYVPAGHIPVEAETDPTSAYKEQPPEQSLSRHDTSPLPVGPYVPPPAEAVSAASPKERRALPLVFPLLGLLLVAGLALLLIPRLSNRTQTPSTQANAQPTQFSPAQVKAVPDLSGQTLEAAQAAAASAGLSLVVGEPVVSADKPEGVVAGQQPAARSQIQAGSPITVSLTTAPAVQQQAPVQPNDNPPARPGKKKGGGHK